MSADTLTCPVGECGRVSSAAPGQLAAHLIDDHGWSKVGALAAEAQLRRDVGAPTAPGERITSAMLRRCGICRRTGHRRETCPERNGNGPSVPDAPEAAEPAVVPALHLVGMLIDGLRDAARALDQTADRFDELVAQGAIQ